MAHKIEEKLEITKSSGNVFADIWLKQSLLDKLIILLKNVL